MFFAKIYNLLNFVMNVVKTEGEKMTEGGILLCQRRMS